MRMRCLTGLAATVAIVLTGFCSSAWAGDEPASVAFGAGIYGLRYGADTAQFEAEYDFAQKFWYFRPRVGAMGTSDGGSFVYAGIGVDVFLGDHIVLNPAFTPGWYNDGGGKKMGNALEFRSSMEVDYRFDDLSRLGLAVSHISNAGLGNKNPGEESLVMRYTVPVAKLFGTASETKSASIAAARY